MSASDPIDEALEGDADDAEALAPTVDIPEPRPGEADLDSDVVSLFWRLVVVGNVALFGLTVGPMVLFFQRQVLVGGGLLAVGLCAGGYGLARYRQFTRERPRAE